MNNSNLLLLAGTSKGLVLYTRNRRWTLKSIHFKGLPVSMVYTDTRSGRWWVAIGHKHWGQKLHYSDDRGATWSAAATPKYPEGEEVHEGKPASLNYIWSIAAENSRVWVGTEPGGLFLSEDGGGSFYLNQPLWTHPTRPDHWFGGGRDEAGIHSIVIDPRNDDHIYVGVSCGGVFETHNGGVSWETRNKGLKADFIPIHGSIAGHDPHMIRMFQKKPELLWQQNHCGIYKSEDGGANWKEISGLDGFPNYGFVMAISQKDENMAWVIPAVSDQMRIPLNESLVVCRTDNGGQSWQEQRTGLPQKGCFDIVLRHSLDIWDETLAFGTNNGNLFLSEDLGENWTCLNNYLSAVFVVVFTST